MVARRAAKGIFLYFQFFFFKMNGFSYFILKNCEKSKRMERYALKWRKKKTAKEKALNLSNTFQFVFTTDSHVYMQDMQRSKLDQCKTSC